jgi:hypothetical protein
MFDQLLQSLLAALKPLVPVLAADFEKWLAQELQKLLQGRGVPVPPLQPHLAEPAKIDWGGLLGKVLPILVQIFLSQVGPK